MRSYTCARRGAALSSDGIKTAVRNALARAPDTIGGSGTEHDPYVILSETQLRVFAEHVDAGDTDWINAVVVLGADLDLSGEAFNPIGAEGKATANSGKLFGGTFDGQGHTISGLTITRRCTEETNLGLFSTLTADARDQRQDAAV